MNNRKKSLSIENMDLNLLKVFRVLAEEKKTISAAKRLNMTQPAVSRALARLREQFNDELFVRTRHGLKPTEKGETLSEKLPLIMDELDSLFRDLQSFEPLTYRANLKIAINGFLGVSLPAKLHLKLKTLAPNVSLYVESWGPATVDKLLKGELDLGINYHSDAPPKELKRSHLAYDTFQVLVRKGHPLEGHSVNLEAFSKYPLVSAIVPDWNDRNPLILDILNDENISVSMRSESLTSLAEVAANSDALFPASEYLSEDLFPQLTRLNISDELSREPEEFSVYIHYRHQRSPFYKWLMELLRNEIAPF